MASYTAAGCSKHATLTANTVDTVTLDARYPLVEVINRHASADLWVTVKSGIDDSVGTVAPAIAADGTFYIAAGAVRTIRDVYDSNAVSIAPTVVQLICVSAAPYSVTGIHGWQ